MNRRLLSSVLGLGALALTSFSPASAAIVGLTVINNDTSFVPVDILPGLPAASSGTVFNDLVGNFLNGPPPPDCLPAGCARSPYEGTIGENTAHYASVEADSSATYNFSGTALRLFWGSLDTYNTLEFLDGGSTIASITGGDLGPPQTTGHHWVWLALTDPLATFDQIRLRSIGADAFEFSTVVACTGECSPVTQLTPIPAALPLFASALAGIGGVFGWRKRRKAKAIAA